MKFMYSMKFFFYSIYNATRLSLLPVNNNLTK